MTWQDDDLVLSLAPLQGCWTAEQYLRLTDQTNRLIEFTDGCIEVLPMPTEHHQAMLAFLFLVLHPLVEQLGGKVRFAPLRLQIRAGNSASRLSFWSAMPMIHVVKIATGMVPIL